MFYGEMRSSTIPVLNLRDKTNGGIELLNEIDLKKTKLVTKTTDLKEDSFEAVIEEVKVTAGIEEEHPEYGDRMRVHLGVKAPWNDHNNAEDLTWINLNYSRKNPETGEYPAPSEKSQYAYFLKALNTVKVGEDQNAGCKIDEVTDLKGQKFVFVRREVEFMKGKPSKITVPIEWIPQQEASVAPQPTSRTKLVK